MLQEVVPNGELQKKHAVSQNILEIQEMILVFLGINLIFLVVEEHYLQLQTINMVSFCLIKFFA